jgi:phage tail sheath gpL-like
MPMFPNAHKGGGPAIHPFSDLSIGSRLAVLTAGGFTVTGSAVWPTASLSILIPVWLPEQIIVAQLGWVNGSVVSGNVDMGIYNQDGVLLLSTGSTAGSGTSALQLVNVTDTPIGPGLVYMALAVDNITATIERTNTGSVLTVACVGLVQVASNFPLAANVTFAVITNDYIHHMGIYKQAVA